MCLCAGSSRKRRRWRAGPASCITWLVLTGLQRWAAGSEAEVLGSVGDRSSPLLEQQPPRSQQPSAMFTGSDTVNVSSWSLGAGGRRLAPVQMPPDALTDLHLKFDPNYAAHIFLAAPAYGGLVTDGFARSLVDLALVAERIPSVTVSIMLLPGDSLITRARNTLVAEFLGSPQYTHLFFVDTDISFKPDHVLRLLERTRKTPIVAAAYPKKGIIFHKLKHAIKETMRRDPNHEFTDEELRDAMTDYVFNPHSENDKGNPELHMQDGFVRVDSAGTGFLMVRRDVLETMAEYYTDLAYENDVTGYNTPQTKGNFYGLFDTMVDPRSKRFLSEDYAFCRRAHALGYEVWMDLFSDLKHAGRMLFDGDFNSGFVFEVPE